MEDLAARFVQHLKLNDELEMVVMELTPGNMKLGIRPRDTGADALTVLASSCLRGCHGYYHSVNGVTMLIVSPGTGQRLQINDCVELSAGRPELSVARLSTDVAAPPDAAFATQCY